MLSVSIDRVISKLIRDMRVSDSSYFADFYEWIPEAMRLLHTGVELKPVAKRVHIDNHICKLPCGLIDLEAVEYQGARLPYYTGIKPTGALKTVAFDSNTTAFVASVTTQQFPSGAVLDIKYALPVAVHASAGYQIHMDHISTTFETGDVILYYKEMQHDDRGLPLVPDHPDYKEAVYWYLRSKMIQSGYDDVMHGHDDRQAWARFELHAARAISDITYPSVDQKEAQLAMGVRFVPPSDYFESFFNSVDKEPLYSNKGIEPNGIATIAGATTPISSFLLPNNGE